jgi:hypothetical protein
MNDQPTASTADITLSNGEVLTEADFERMALEAETTLPDVERIKGRRRAGRPPLGSGTSSVIQIRLDEQTRQELDERAVHDQTTPSKIVRDALRAWLSAS